VVLQGDARHIGLKDSCVQCVVTSPPYWAQRNYLVNGQLGLEPTPDAYIAAMVEVFREVLRVLKNDGTCWLVLGDSYAGAGSAHRDPERWPKQKAGAHHVGRVKGRTGLRDKNLLLIPARVALALQQDGWYVRSAIVWQKGNNPMPEAVADRPGRAYENIFLLAKSEHYYCDRSSLPAPYRRDVWMVPNERRAGNHFAAFPRKLAELCILAGSRPGDLVFDPFIGSGTVGEVAEEHGRQWVGMDLNAQYVADVNREARARNDIRIATSNHQRDSKCPKVSNSYSFDVVGRYVETENSLNSLSHVT
jgi:site-specific DNA-methyltransferase (cytosine-N4-specific)